MINSQILIVRCEDGNKGLVLEKGLDCNTIVVGPNGPIEPVDYNGVNYVPCNIGDTIVLRYNEDKSIRSFKVVGIERSGHFFICEIVYDELELIEMQLLELAEQVEAGDMNTNCAHLKADQLIVSLLYSKGFDKIADAFNKVPKYYE